MGAGRKTVTEDVDTKTGTAYSLQSFEERQRNLGEKLGGCIFGCTNDTIEECIADMVFGLPRAHWCYVQWISKGMPIFLFNYITRKLHGIFEAESDGEWEIKPEGWCKSEGTRTFYPSQVRVRLVKDCEPLLEREFSQIVPQCCREEGHHLFELRASEARALCEALEAKTTRSGKPGGTQLGQLAKTAKPYQAAQTWGSQDSPREAPRVEQEVPKLSDFPALPGADPETVVLPPAPRLPVRISGSAPASARAPDPAPAPAPKRPASLRVPAPVTPPSAPAASPPAPSWAAASKVGPSHAVERSASNASSHLSSLAAVGSERSRPHSRAASESGVSTPKEPAGSSAGGQASLAPPPPLQSLSLGEQPRRTQPPPAANGTSGASSSSSRQLPPPATLGPGGLTPPAAAAASEEHAQLLERVHRALWPVNAEAADALTHMFGHLRAAAERDAKDRYALARIAQKFKMEKDALQALAVRQSEVIGLLQDEAVALRRDLAFIGGHLNIRVAPANHAVMSAELPTLQSPAQPAALPQPQQTPPASLPSHQAAAPPAQQMRVQPPASQPSPISLEPPAPPRPTNPERLLLFGGHDLTKWLQTVDVFSPVEQRWRVLDQPMPRTAGYGAAAALGPSVYVIGGGAGTGRQWSEDCLCFDAHRETWTQVASMEEVRGSLAAAALGGRVFAIGGGRKGEQLADVEIYDPQRNAWMRGKAMKSKRFGVSACVADGSLVVVGGYDGLQYLGSGERYDPREGFWHSLPALAEGRGGHQLVTAGSEVWALGGWDGRGFLNSVEALDPRAGGWRPLAPMQAARAYFGAACLDGVVHAIGGMGSSTDANTLPEFFERSSGQWREATLQAGAGDSTRRRAFVAACKLDAS